MTKNIYLTFVLLIASACASIPSVESDFDSSYDISKYKTFLIEPIDGKNDSSQISLNPILIKRVMRSIQSELDFKGFSKSEDPDLIIKVLVGTNRENNKSHESSQFFYSPNGWRDTYTRYYPIDKEAIAIRVYDKKSNEVVWYAFSRFKKNQVSKDQESIDDLIGNMLTNFLN